MTDVTNASRTLLMDLRTLDWSPECLDAVGIPRAMLPAIRSSSEVYGELRAGTALDGVPIAGVLGDQQAALFGQACFDPGRGEEHVWHRLLPARQHRRRAGRLARAADDGRLPARRASRPRMRSRARSRSTGAAMQWLRDQLGIDRLGRRGRGARGERAGHGRRVLRAGVQRPVRAATGTSARAARSSASPPTRRRRTSRARRWRRPPGRCARRSVRPGTPSVAGARPPRAEGRRRHDRQRAADAVPGRRAGRARRAPAASPRRPRSAPPTRPGSPSASGPLWRTCARTGGRRAAGSRAWTRGEVERRYAPLAGGGRALAELDPAHPALTRQVSERAAVGRGA